jgi:hypothetical protein
MVTIEFERPSKWSMGQMIGFIAIIFLIIGPFLPYLYNYPYIRYEFFGLLRFIPFISAVLIATLLYFRIPLFIKKNSNFIKINHFILIIWGFWFLLSHFVDTFPFTGPSQGYGFWMIICGYFLCMLSGYLEWRHPTMISPLATFVKEAKEKSTAK